MLLVLLLLCVWVSSWLYSVCFLGVSVRLCCLILLNCVVWVLVLVLLFDGKCIGFFSVLKLVWCSRIG